MHEARRLLYIMNLIIISDDYIANLIIIFYMVVRVLPGQGAPLLRCDHPPAPAGTCTRRDAAIRLCRVVILMYIMVYHCYYFCISLFLLLCYALIVVYELRAPAPHFLPRTHLGQHPAIGERAG